MSESSIRALAQGVIDSKENLNNLVDLLEHLQSPSPAVLKWSCEAISTAYEHVVIHNYVWLVHRPQNSGKSHDLEPKNEVVLKFQEWMKKNYASCKEQLLQLLTHESHDVQEAALDALMSFIKSEGTSHISTLHTYTFPNSLLHQVTGHLLDNQTDMISVIGHFSDYLTYDDIRFYWMKNIASVLSFKKVCSDSMEQLLKNAFSALQPLHLYMATNDSCLNQFFAGDPASLLGREEEKVDNKEEGEDGERAGSAGEVTEEEEREDEQLTPPKPKKSRSQVRAHDVQTYQKHQRQFSEAWLSFLRLQLSSTMHKKILVILHSEVMPHLIDPRLLLDYLVDSYNSGGVVSLLALNGLFILMHQYHLDYPDFYPKLYGLLEPSVFHVKYMPRFFSLMDTFLSSTHLPLYMVAAFAKKVARLALNAPPQGVMVAVVFVINLLKRHPNCKVLLHRKNGEGVSLENDSFLIEERDMSLCQALESCLWELKTLQSHYCPEVSQLVTQLLNSVNKKLEEDIGKYLARSSDEMLAATETKISDEKEVPLNFELPANKWELT